MAIADRVAQFHGHRTPSKRGPADVWAGRLGRFGLACRGLVYLVIALLALNLARGRSAQADQQGALEDIARHPFGHFLVLAIAVGFLCLAAWQGWWAVRARGPQATGSRRLIAAGKALVYLVLSVGALAVFLNRPGKSNSDQQAMDLTARVMRHSFGRTLVGAVGIGVCVVGLFLIWKALHRGYDVEVQVGAVPAKARRPFEVLGVVGMTARGIVVTLIGGFVVQAAVTFDPAHAKGLDGALRSVVHAPFGPWLLALIGVGLASFGLFSLLEARVART